MSNYDDPLRIHVSMRNDDNFCFVNSSALLAAITTGLFGPTVSSNCGSVLPEKLSKSTRTIIA